MAATNSSRILSSTGCLSTADGNRILANRMAANGNRAIPLCCRAATNFYGTFTDCIAAHGYGILTVCRRISTYLYRTYTQGMAADGNGSIILSRCA